MQLSALTKKLLKAALVLILFQGLSFILFINNLRDLKNVDRVIAEDITVYSQWSEITPSNPLTACQRAQFVTLYVKGGKKAVNAASGSAFEHQDSIELQDGTVVTPEIQVIDEYGHVYDLRVAKVIYSANSFTLPFDLGKDASFPKDRVYPMVRIRSDKPIQCSKVTWHCRI